MFAACLKHLSLSRLSLSLSLSLSLPFSSATEYTVKTLLQGIIFYIDALLQGLSSKPPLS